MIIRVGDPSGVGAARRTAAAAARAQELPEPAIARVALVATELATNLLKHAGAGVLAIEAYEEHGRRRLELLSLDQGPGIADVSRCLADGYSTAGGPGTGLGAATRNSETLAIYSRPGKGTAIVARFVDPPEKAGSGHQFGLVLEPYPGETICGDRWASARSESGLTLLLVDGSGHGPLAAQAAATAVSAFAAHIEEQCVPMVEAIHHALAPTRGAALAVARIDARARAVRFVGIGNIGAVLASGGETRQMVSYNGTAGHIAPRIREFVYPYTGAPLVILHSDGISKRWDLSAYPGLAASDPSLIAGILFRDHQRGRDDAAIIAVRTEG